MRERINLDHKKLKDEDRRFLLENAWNEVVVNEQGSMHNTSMTLSILAIGISCFSVVLTTGNLLFISIYALLFFVGIYIYSRKLDESENKLKNESDFVAMKYKTLLNYHLDYAKK